MSYSFFTKEAPFTYSPIPLEERKADFDPDRTFSIEEQNQAIKNKPKDLAILGPKKNDQEILGDINRDLGNKFFIHNQPILKLRKKERLTPAQYKITELKDDVIDKMALKNVKNLLMPLVIAKVSAKQKILIDQIMNTNDLTHAQQLLKNYQKLLIGPETLGFESILEAKEFLKRHLLSPVKNSQEQDFLAEQAIRGLHQSGYTHVVEGYYSAKCQAAIHLEGAPPVILQGQKDVNIINVDAPERVKANVTYKNGRIFFESAIHYHSMTGSDGKTHDPDTKVTSIFSIKAIKPFFSRVGFKIDFRVDELKTNMEKDKTLAPIFKEAQPKKSLLQYLINLLTRKGVASISENPNIPMHQKRK